METFDEDLDCDERCERSARALRSMQRVHLACDVALWKVKRPSILYGE